MIRGSVGTVKTEQVTFKEPLTLESGVVLPELTIAYETYGTLDRDRSNAILICHALSGDSHAAGYHAGDEKPGWWDIVIGPGKALDTDQYFIICSNVLGGCKGTTGPASVNPETNKPYGLSFPVITIGDMVHAQRRLLDHFNIQRLFAVIGGSMGGMQALTWSALFPDLASRVVVIASTAYSTPQQIAFNEVARSAIRSDPDWNHGNYYENLQPTRGLSLPRMIGHITYRSDESMHQKFGRGLQGKDELGFDFTTDFQVESYLHYQGDKFTHRFDANSYLYITKAIDYHDLSVNGSLSEAFRSAKAKFLIVSISTDWLYPPYLSQEIVSALSSANVDVEYCEIRSNFGHDAFLLEEGQMNYILGRFLTSLTIADVMKVQSPTLTGDVTIKEAAELMITHSVNHLPVIDAEGALTGIVTSWDISRSVAREFTSLDEIMTRDVFFASPEEPVDSAVKRMELNHISALPVVDEKRRVIGLITAERLSRLIGRCR